MSTLGRPSKLDAVVDPDKGTTVADRIVQNLRAGNYVETAAQAAGVSKTTLYDWLREGARLATDLASGKRTRSSLSKKQRQLVEFSHAVADAQAEAEARDVAQLTRLANGGVPTQVVTTKTDARGNVIERTEKVEHSAPNPQVLEWRLERRHPDRWGRKQAIEHSGPGGGAIPVHVQAEQVVAVLTGVLDDLGVAMTDEVRQVCAAHLRSMATTPQGELVEAN